MPKRLKTEGINQFHRDGYYFPLRILQDRQVNVHRERLETFEKSQGKPIVGAQRCKSHLLFKWVDDLMRHDGILDAVEDLIGPDILC